MIDEEESERVYKKGQDNNIDMKSNNKGESLERQMTEMEEAAYIELIDRVIAVECPCSRLWLW